jgi:transcriptional antiterminator Rof (Rho-off)
MNYTKDSYIPVSCQQHSEFELAIMRGQKVQLTYTIKTGKRLHSEFLPLDLLTRNGEEFLVVSDGKAKQDIRLDHIEKMRILE